jgi:hypothetical protein
MMREMLIMTGEEENENDNGEVLKIIFPTGR